MSDHIKAILITVATLVILVAVACIPILAAVICVAVAVTLIPLVIYCLARLALDTSDE